VGIWAEGLAPFWRFGSITVFCNNLNTAHF